MSTLEQLLRERVEFDIVSASNEARIECKTMLRDMVSRGTAQMHARNLAAWENNRLQPLLDSLIKVAVAAEEVELYCDELVGMPNLSKKLKKANDDLRESLK